MQLFSSWSGGKDCMLALYRIQKSGTHQVKVLLNMCDASSDLSRSHVIRQSKYFLGRVYDAVFIEELSQIEGVDLCAELGEFHSFVYDGPNFNHPVSFQKGAVSFRENHWFLEII
ncbi:MAG: hypothetical protein M0R21_10070 [Lentimicrobiaceae bacterium]|nr:hypothetical protein [Lentimicrobiaceae bacterium]